MLTQVLPAQPRLPASAAQYRLCVYHKVHHSCTNRSSAHFRIFWQIVAWFQTLWWAWSWRVLQIAILMPHSFNIFYWKCRKNGEFPLRIDDFILTNGRYFAFIGRVLSALPGQLQAVAILGSVFNGRNLTSYQESWVAIRNPDFLLENVDFIIAQRPPCCKCPRRWFSIAKRWISILVLRK